jgi:hypothetical protein
MSETRKRRWPLYTSAAAFTLLGVVGMGACASTVATAPQPPAVAVAPAAPAAPAGPTIKDGGYEVGPGANQVVPGKYHTDGPGNGIAPYAIIKDANGQIDRVINIDGPYTITLTQGQAFETHGGAIWALVQS